MFVAADLLGLGHSISSSGETLGLALTFIGIGVIANVLVVYAIVVVLAERRQNHERMERYERSQPRDAR